MAAFPNGDKYGRKLPLMWNIVDVVGVGSLFDEARIDDHHHDFERLYSTLAESGEHDELVAKSSGPFLTISAAWNCLTSQLCMTTWFFLSAIRM